VLSSLEEALQHCYTGGENQNIAQVFVIGGGELYKVWSTSRSRKHKMLDERYPSGLLLSSLFSSPVFSSSLYQEAVARPDCARVLLTAVHSSAYDETLDTFFPALTHEAWTLKACSKVRLGNLGVCERCCALFLFPGFRETIFFSRKGECRFLFSCFLLC